VSAPDEPPAEPLAEPRQDEAPPAPPVPARRERAPDDSDIGWGERLTDPDDEDRRYLEDRPPHWGSD
jgi:hypothetical protein